MTNETKPTLRYHESCYLDWDPGSGDKDDGGVRNRTVKLVVARKEYPCWMGLPGCFGDGHTIKPGDLHVREKAILDNEWMTARACLSCVEKEIEEYEGG